MGKDLRHIPKQPIKAASGKAERLQQAQAAQALTRPAIVVSPLTFRFEKSMVANSTGIPIT